MTTRVLMVVVICMVWAGSGRAQTLEFTAQAQPLGFSVQNALVTGLVAQASSPARPQANPSFGLEQSTSQRPGALEWLFGTLPAGFAGQAVGLRLMAWSLPWIGAGIIGLWASNDAYWKGFWGMNAAWGLINTSIAFAGLLGSEPDPASLRTILLVNAGLDVLYVVGGVYLLTRPEDTWCGAGVAVIVQGAFLLIFDLLHAFLIPGL
jgi:hypothetical protein